jgi:hypothetical protein
MGGAEMCGAVMGGAALGAALSVALPQWQRRLLSGVEAEKLQCTEMFWGPAE